MTSEMPEGVQRRRTKGWCLPPNTVCVDRSTKFGNPFTVARCIDAGYAGTPEQARQFVVDCFESWLQSENSRWAWIGGVNRRLWIIDNLHLLRGKNLACWCPLDGPCHRNVYLNILRERY